MRKLFIILMMFLFMALAACNTDTPDVSTSNSDDEINTPVATTPPLDLSVSEDAAGLTGRVVSSMTEEPLANMEVWLAAVVWNEDHTEGAYFIDGSASPTTRTRNDGRFFFNDLQPKDYVIVIGDLFGQNVAMSNNDGSARIYPAELGRIEDAGTLRVDLESPPTPAPFDPYPEPADEQVPEEDGSPEAYP